MSKDILISYELKEDGKLDRAIEYKEVLCCCDPNNCVGYVPKEEGEKAGLVLRELEDGGEAFDSNHNEEAVKKIPGFKGPDTAWNGISTRDVFAGKKPAGTKTWKKKPSGPKTWRK